MSLESRGRHVGTKVLKTKGEYAVAGWGRNKGGVGQRVGLRKGKKSYVKTFVARLRKDLG